MRRSRIGLPSVSSTLGKYPLRARTTLAAERAAHRDMVAAMTRDEWIAAFAGEAGVERPSNEQVRELLSLAGVAAHASERTAAPIACWIAGRSELSLDELSAAAERIDPPEGD
jgi:uncharacterized protein DUF6457